MSRMAFPAACRHQSYTYLLLRLFQGNKYDDDDDDDDGMPDFVQRSK